MKILAAADIHGREASLRRLCRVCGETCPEVLVLAGDITGWGNDEHVFEILESLALPVLAVHGNVDADDLTEMAARYRNIRSLHLREETVAGVPFVGWGGGVSATLLERFLPRRSTKNGIEAVPSLKEDTVFVTHIPPWGILDSGFASLHGGSKALRQLLEDRQPRLMICGHIHECRGIERLGKTTVVNCSMGIRGTGALIELRRDGGMEIDFL
ncbi:MAG: metallophosphoesterase family protein [Syntrophobacterales bacterium]|nr:metallophosphoesterase family protein [Syntrophobacterales bacterium]